MRRRRQPRGVLINMSQYTGNFQMRNEVKTAAVRVPAILATGVLVAGTLAGCVSAPPTVVPAWGADLVGVTQYNRVVSFNHGAPGTFETSVAISGLAAGESVVAVDYRPSDGKLYALGSAGAIYLLDWRTGKLSAHAQLSGSGSSALDGNVFDIDFTADGSSLHVVSDAGQHLAVNPETGAVTVLPAFDAANKIVAAAYTTTANGAFANTLYLLNNVKGIEIESLPGNADKPVSVGTLTGSFGRYSGFDILGNEASGVAYAALSIPDSTQSKLYAIQLGAGAGKSYGNIGGDAKLRSLTIRPTTAS